MTIQEKFAGLGIDNAPGQEALQKKEALDLRGEKLLGARVDFSHGDVDAHMPTPGSFDVFKEGFEEGGSQAYTPYRGRKKILDHVAASLSGFTGASIDPEENLILTPGTQGALFLAMGANIMPGDKVAIVEPDYFANRKMVEFFGGQMVPVVLEYENEGGRAGISLESLEEAFKDGVKLFLFSNPNNPVGCVYSYEEITGIAALAKKYGVTLIVDELYSRQVYPGIPYTHLCAQKEIPENLITILGPSKTESLSGFRLGAAFDRKTGEALEPQELFTCSPEALITALLNCSEVTEPTLRREMTTAFRPEYLVFFPEHLEVSFPQGVLPSQEHAYILSIPYEDLPLPPWAIPETAA